MSTTFFNVSAGELKTGSFFREGDAATGTGGVDNPEGPAVGTGDCVKAGGVKARQDAARRMRVRSGVIFMVQNAGGFFIPPHRQQDIFYVRRRSSRNPTLPAHLFTAVAEAPRYSALLSAGLSFSTPLFQ